MLDPRQEELYRAWCREAKARDQVPPRSAFDPIDFPLILPFLALYELLEDEAVRIRVIGTEIVRAWGRDNTWCCLHEIMEGGYYDFIRGQIDQCRSQRVPLYSRSRFQWDRGRSLDTRRLLLPYRRDEATDAIGYILLCQVFDYGRVGPFYPVVHIDAGFDFLELDRQELSATPEEAQR